MPVNLNDWLGDHVWAWWSGFLVLLLTAALVARSRTGLAAAGGPAVAAPIAVWTPFWLHALIALTVSGVLVGVVGLRRRSERPADPAPRRAA